jgi:protein TonB
MLALPKTLDASALKELGCRIPAPEYPPAARRLGQSGTVRLLIKIGTDGKFSGVQVVHGSGYADLDNAAQAAISRGSCNPYLQNGVPVSVTAVQPITFNLDN